MDIHRPGRAERVRGATAYMVAGIALLTSACTFAQNSHYEVNNDGISGVNATIYQYPTNQFAVVYDAFCHDDITCTVSAIRTYVHVSGWGAAQWNHSLYYSGSLQYELNNVIRQGALDNYNAGGPCLLMNYWITAEASGLNEHFAWRTHGAGSSDCRFGTSLFT